jgi:hypothetical protein
MGMPESNQENILGIGFLVKANSFYVAIDGIH